MKRRTSLLLGLLALLTAPVMALLAAPPQQGPAIDKGKAEVIPWSGYWWPMTEGGMTDPLAKYDQITGRQAMMWQTLQHPFKTEDWFGYCHAWAAAAILEPEPLVPIVVSGLTGEEVTLTVADQKAWLAACHSSDIPVAFGRRFRKGDPEEYKQSLAPDMLWRLLQTFVQQHKVPLIVNLHPGGEVWNNPVFAYRVEYRRVNDDGDHVGRMILLLTDADVEPNFVGVQAFAKVYYFRCRMREGAVVAGSGKWIGPSVEDHPGFAWYPLVRRSENPYIHYPTVKKILQAAILPLPRVDSEVLPLPRVNPELLPSP